MMQVDINEIDVNSCHLIYKINELFLSDCMSIYADF